MSAVLGILFSIAIIIFIIHLFKAYKEQRRKAEAINKMREKGEIRERMMKQFYNDSLEGISSNRIIVRDLIFKEMGKDEKDRLFFNMEYQSLCDQLMQEEMIRQEKDKTIKLTRTGVNYVDKIFQNRR